MSQPTNGDLALGVFWIIVIFYWLTRCWRGLLRKKARQELLIPDKSGRGGAVYVGGLAESRGHLLSAPSQSPGPIGGFPNEPRRGSEQGRE